MNDYTPERAGDPNEEKPYDSVRAEITRRAEKDATYVRRLLDDVEANAATSPEDKERATELRRQLEAEEGNLQEAVGLVSSMYEKIASPHEEAPSESECRIVAEFDPLLIPIRILHGGLNTAVLCDHPDYGRVVLKHPSSAEEKDLLRRAQEAGVDNIAKLCGPERYGEKPGMLTEYIPGEDLSNIMLGAMAWGYEDGKLFFGGKEIGDEESIKEKLRIAVEKLHALGQAGFDIRPKK